MIAIIVFSSIFILVGVILCIIANTEVIAGTIIGILLIILGSISMYLTGIAYYESKIPNIQEQVQEYNIRIAEEKLLELKGEK